MVDSVSTQSPSTSPISPTVMPEGCFSSNVRPTPPRGLPATGMEVGRQPLKVYGSHTRHCFCLLLLPSHPPPAPSAPRRCLGDVSAAYGQRRQEVCLQKQHACALHVQWALLVDSSLPLPAPLAQWGAAAGAVLPVCVPVDSMNMPSCLHARQLDKLGLRTCTAPSNFWLLTMAVAEKLHTGSTEIVGSACNFANTAVVRSHKLLLSNAGNPHSLYMP